jgi:hypothetical protein
VGAWVETGVNLSLAVGGLAVALFSCGSTLFVAWLLRRDTQGRSSAAESTRVGELERRIAALEASGVSQRDFDALSRRLDGIQADIREIRNYQVNLVAERAR